MYAHTDLLSQLPSPVALLQGPELVIVQANPPLLQIWNMPLEAVLRKPFFEVFPQLTHTGLAYQCRLAYTSGTTQVREVVPWTRQQDGAENIIYFKIIFTPFFTEAGAIAGVIASGFDITTEVQSRLEAESTRQHLNNLVSQMAAGLAQTDLEGNILEVNSRYCELLGYSRAELLHRNLSSLVHPDDWAVIRPGFEQCVAEGIALNNEKRCIRKDGSIVWVSNSLSRISTAQGPAFLTELCIDISAEKGMQASLAEKTREVTDYKYALDRSSIVAITDQRGLILHVNENFCTISKYSAEELIGQDHRMLNSGYHPPEFFRTLWRTIGQGKVWKGEIRNRAKDGTIYWVDTTIIPFLDRQGKPYQYVAIRNDITSRKLVEESIRESEERYATVVAASDLGLWDFDVPAGKILAAGKMAELYSLASNEAYNLDVVMNSVHPEDSAGQQEILEAIINSKVDTSFITEFRIRDQKTGAVKWLRAKARAFFDEQGKLYRTVGTAADITAQKLAQVQLQENEERLQLVMAAADIGMWDHDIRKHETVVSERTRQVYGVKAGEKFTFERFLEAIHPADRERVGAINRALMKGEMGTHYLEEFRILLPGGKIRWVRSFGRVLLDGGGQPYRFIGAILDITEERLAAQALQEREQEFRSLAENTPDIIARHDLAFRYLFANPQIERVTGRPPVEIIGLSFEEVGFPEKLCHFMRAQLSRVLQSGKPHAIEYPSIDGNGWAYSRLVPELDEQGKVKSIMSITTDVSVLKKAEQELRLAKEQLELTFQHVPAGIFLFDKGGQLLYFNEKGSHMMGYASEAVVKSMSNYTQLAAYLTTHFEVKNMAGDRVPVANSAVSTTFKARQPTEVQLQLTHRQTGERSWINTHAAPLFDENGELLLVLNTITDITSQQLFTQKLEEEVARRTRELQRSNEDLQQFAHAASHDLKEPVRKVLTFLDRLQREYKPLLPEKAHMYLDRIEVAARRSYSLIEGLLRYSKVDAAAIKYLPINLDEVFGHIASDLELPIQQKGAHFQLETLPVLEGAPELVYQLFYNLVNNSLKFARAGEAPLVKVYAGEEPAPEGMAAIVVEDNGIGFDPAHAEKIFQIYTRLHSKDLYEGSGLGLALCRKIVERHGGTIRATAQPGKGARFELTLPVWKDATTGEQSNPY